MSKVAENLARLKATLPDRVKIVAVSKTMPVDLVSEAYAAGQRLFGENRVQELLAKSEYLPPDISWHQIGHLQTNKVKYIAPFISMIQSTDSYRLLQTIDREGAKAGRIIDCLLQIHIATEETKFGFSFQEIAEMVGDSEFSKLKNVNICGVMGMATFTDDRKLIQKEFGQLRSYFQMLKDDYFAGTPCFCELSMGMSGDYVIAVDEGSTIIRVGTLIFGER